MKDYTQLTPTQRVLLLSIKRHASEPQLQKPGINIDVLIGWLCCAAITWGGLYLLGHIVVAVYRALAK